MLDLKETSSGAVGAICNVYSGLPFDVAKVRLQTTSEYRGLVHCIVRTVREEGMRSMWKGATPALSSAIIENSVLFTAHGALRRLYFGQNCSTTLLDEALLGSAAAVFSATAITPAEVIKCRLQTSHTPSLGVLACIRQVVAENGVKGFGAGLPAVLLRDVPFNFVFFGAYELYTSTLASLWRDDDLTSPSTSRRTLHPLAVLACGGMAGATGWSLIFPADVVKSYMQVGNQVTFRRAFLTVWQTQGVRGFYRGWSAAVLRSFPANGCLFLGVEMTHRVFDQVQPDSNDWGIA
ncbi:hypothetical protein H310_10476 [Aphanomyces invadans]|uniref:Uncharacterized protein n=1 Tax=Aphanomyces invadans TaxID=157072 RepID=A0A024TRR5_9STRA|nr:hypothetical protein H310_10476 [Aphanomyces invadans]ETV96311.1 hypothetical protein H310_10476 [Aphanomyces invadans]RHY19827.1 hypothetical protein DYB32_010167 [Aphanomyces invadans]|eukprot:XP_008875103.1 hypothetical protein H310_10476 [Aphanomyces invadans]